MKKLFNSFVIFLMGAGAGAYSWNEYQLRSIDDALQFSYESDLNLYKKIESLMDSRDYGRLEKFITELILLTEISLGAYEKDKSDLLRAYEDRYHDDDET